MGPNELLLSDKTESWEDRLHGKECVLCGSPTKKHPGPLLPVPRKDCNLVPREGRPFSICTSHDCVMSEGVIEPAAIRGALVSRFFDAPVIRGIPGFPRGQGSPVGRLDLYVEIFESACVKWSPDNSVMFADDSWRFETVPEALTAVGRFIPDDGRGDPGRKFNENFWRAEAGLLPVYRDVKITMHTQFRTGGYMPHPTGRSHHGQQGV